MFKIAICDDEQGICSSIENIILDYQRSTLVEIDLEVFYSGEELCAFIESENTFDLIFLDIEMEPLNGIEVGKRIRIDNNDYITKIVYISGKDSYYKQLFDVQPLHFLSKPLDADKIIADLRLAMKLSNKLDGVFSYKKGYESHKIYVKDILYFESKDRKIRIVFVKGEDTFYGKLDEILSQIGKYQFMRIHKSFIINYAYVHKFKYDEVIMSNSVCLPISQSRRKEIRELQIGYEREEFK